MRNVVITSLIVLVLLVSFGSSLIEPLRYQCINNDETEFLEFVYVPMRSRVYIANTDSALVNSGGLIIGINNISTVEASRTYRNVYSFQFDKETRHITYMISTRLNKQLYLFDGTCDLTE